MAAEVAQVVGITEVAGVTEIAGVAEVAQLAGVAQVARYICGRGSTGGMAAEVPQMVGVA